MKPFIALVAAGCFLGLLVKSRELLRRPADLTIRQLCLLLAAMTVSMIMQLLGAVVDRYTGIPMLGRLLSNCAILVAAGAGQALLIGMYYPEPIARSKVRRRYGVLSATLLAIGILFVVTPAAPDSSPARPDAAAGTPTVYDSPYLYLYFAYLAWTLLAVMPLSIRYAALTNQRHLRIGLHLITLAVSFGVAYTAVKVGALVAHRLGADVRGLEPKIAPPLFLAADTLLIVGVTIRSWGPQIAAGLRWLALAVAYWHIYPLWSAVRRVNPEIDLTPDSPRRRLALRDLRFRLYRLVIEIRDGQLALRSYLDPRAARISATLGRLAGQHGDGLRITVEASTLAAAIAAKHAGDHPTVTEDTPADSAENADLAAEIVWLHRVSRVFRKSPVVAETLARLGSEADDATAMNGP